MLVKINLCHLELEVEYALRYWLNLDLLHPRQKMSGSEVPHHLSEFENGKRMNTAASGSYYGFHYKSLDNKTFDRNNPNPRDLLWFRWLAQNHSWIGFKQITSGINGEYMLVANDVCGSFEKFAPANFSSITNYSLQGNLFKPQVFDGEDHIGSLVSCE